MLGGICRTVGPSVLAVSHTRGRVQRTGRAWARTLPAGLGLGPRPLSKPPLRPSSGLSIPLWLMHRPLLLPSWLLWRDPVLVRDGAWPG